VLEDLLLVGDISLPRPAAAEVSVDSQIACRGEPGDGTPAETEESVGATMDPVGFELEELCIPKETSSRLHSDAPAFFPRGNEFWSLLAQRHRRDFVQELPQAAAQRDEEEESVDATMGPAGIEVEDLHVPKETSSRLDSEAPSLISRGNEFWGLLEQGHRRDFVQEQPQTAAQRDEDTEKREPFLPSHEVHDVAGQKSSSTISNEEVAKDRGLQTQYASNPEGSQGVGAQEISAGDEVAARAEQLKTKGNQAFRHGAYMEALGYYTDALALEPFEDKVSAVLYANSAAVFLKLGDHHRAARSCEDAFDHDPKNVKAVYRGAEAYRQLRLFKKAAIFCDRGLRIAPQDTELLSLKQTLIDEYHA